jgi:hydroxyacid-oxoacid transhydrogenase
MRNVHNPACPCHGCQTARGGMNMARAGLNMIQGHNAQPGNNARGYARPVDQALSKDYAFEVRQ